MWCSLYHLRSDTKGVAPHNKSMRPVTRLCFQKASQSFNQRTKVLDLMEEIHVARNLGSSEGPNLVWWEVVLFDTDETERKVVLSSAILSYYEIGTYPS